MNWQCQLYLLPSDFQIQLYCAKVIDVHSYDLRLSSKQVFCFAGDTSHQNMSSKAFQFSDLHKGASVNN